MADLILRGGRIVDPANARDEVADVAFSGGKVVALGADLGRDGAEIVDVRGLIVAPGLIDLHTHVYWGGTSLEVAEEIGLPVMAHLDNPPPSRLEVLSRLRRGDILTHCFRPFPNAPVAPDGRVREEVQEARRRGVIFDIGHGSGSFGFRTAEHMLEAGFLPDAISSDVHTMSINGPAYDQLVTMGKFLALGLDLAAVIGASSAAPAAALGRADLGRLSVGAIGDASVLELIEREVEYRDALGEIRPGRHQLAARGLVVGGQWWHPPR